MDRRGRLGIYYPRVEGLDAWKTLQSGSSHHECFEGTVPEGRTVSDDRSRPGPDNGWRILFMDDEEMLRKAVPRMLATAGYDVECASDGDEAIDLYRAALDAGRPFDVVILDLGVKQGRGGEETIDELIAVDPDVRAILSSGRLTEASMVSFERFGFAGAIEKPYTGSELRAAIAKVLGEK